MKNMQPEVPEGGWVPLAGHRHPVPSLKVHLWLWFHLHPGFWHRLRGSVFLNKQRNGVITPSGFEALCESRNETLHSSKVPSVRDAWGHLFLSPELQSPLWLFSAVWMRQILRL